MNEPQLRALIADYTAVTGYSTDRFVCPLTLRECVQSELVDGHILNKAILVACRRQVIQYSKIDHYYGQTVEPLLIDWLNLPKRSGADVIRSSRRVTVVFHDGSEAVGFPADGAAGDPSRCFPVVQAKSDGELVPVYVKVPKDDPRLAMATEIYITHIFLPVACTAALIKSALLAQFAMLGYRSVFDPMGDTVRRTVASFYTERIGVEGATNHFYDFRRAARLLANGSPQNEAAGQYSAFELDTLGDQALLLHITRSQLTFAATSIFRINGVTMAVTLPQTIGGGDVATAWQCYKRLMSSQPGPDHVVRVARYTSGMWTADAPRRIHLDK